VDQRENLLATLAQPARYAGGEALSVVKDPANVRLTLALCFPEVYEIAMSHLGLKVLYDSLAARPEVAAERVFAPWLDLMALLEERGIAPWSLESGRPLGDFDVIGFSLPYEMTYTNLLAMLRLAGVPLRRVDRGPSHPLVIAGGPAMVNPEPLADFLDLAVVGEAEELIHPLVDLFMQAKEEAWPRERLYREASRLEGVYAPALFQPVYEGGRLREIVALDPEFPHVRRRVVADLGAHEPPTRQVSPLVRPVHDRLGLELARGCTRGCRFCQAGYIYRPVRERPAAQLLQAACAGIAATGFEEVALLSLSTGDYTCIEPLALALMDAMEARKVSLSLPSLRVDSLSPGLAAQIKRVRKTGFTLAPEAGSQRLREVINKGLDREQILETARSVFSLGWRLVKLYFMLGLPTETDEDIAALGELAAAVARQAGKGKGGGPVVHASLGVFVPKPHTPFQWERQIDSAEAKRRLTLAKGGLGDRRVKAKWGSPEQSVLEGVFSRGDRRLGAVLEAAMEAGCRFDGWSEELKYDTWLKALEGAGLSLEEFLRPRGLDEPLPWDHIQVGVSKEFLLAEREKALAGEFTPDCRAGRCLDCGVCDHQLIKPRLVADEPLSPTPPAPPPGQPCAYIFRFSKTGPARFLGHLDMMQQLQRAFRRAGVELAHSQGFHPHPMIKTDSALPVGLESLAEVLMATVLGRPQPEEVRQRINRCLPQGLVLEEARLARPGENLSEPKEVIYLLRAPVPLKQEAIEAFKAVNECRLVRQTPKGSREINLKEAVRDMELTPAGLTVVVGHAGGRPKPTEILMAVFGLNESEALAARALKVGLR
jgi:radical SAM family uncharacterized protein/radical SAM-linked protein